MSGRSGDGSGGRGVARRPASGREARPYAEGNTKRLTSGRNSVRVYGELAQHLAAGLVEDRPDLGAYPEAVAAWATAEAQATLMRRHVVEVGWLDESTGRPRETVLKWLRIYERLAASHRATLGLDPRSEAALARERTAAAVLSVDLDALAQRGRDALAAREAAGIAPPPDLAGEVLASVQAAGEQAQRLADERRRGGDDHSHNHDEEGSA